MYSILLWTFSSGLGGQKVHERSVVELRRKWKALLTSTVPQKVCQVPELRTKGGTLHVPGTYDICIAISSKTRKTALIEIGELAEWGFLSRGPDLLEARALWSNDVMLLMKEPFQTKIPVCSPITTPN